MESNFRANLKGHFYVFRDSILAIIFGIVLGFVLDIFFPEPKKSENFWTTTFLLGLQILISGFILYYYSVFYYYFYGSEVDTYLGFSVFSVIFFLVQTQLLNRLDLIYKHMSGKDL